MHIRLTRLLDVFVVFCLLALTIALVHFVTTDRLGVLRALYPAEASLAKLSTRCSPGAPAWLSDLLDYTVDQQSSLANQVAFIAPDGSIHRCEGGWQGALLLSPRVDQSTRFRYASLSKLFTADAVLARVDAGTFTLSSHLVELLPELSSLKDERLRSVTIEQLLRHSWGFDRLKSADPMTTYQVKPWCPGDLSPLAELKLDFAPGERYAYSNLGYCLLGVVLERAAGKPFRALLAEEYNLDGLGMRFIDGPYLNDEVRYDFRNSNFYGESYYQYFDFRALSSAAGLSGSAVPLAQSIKRMLNRSSLNILSAQIDSDCDHGQHGNCYGFAVSPYRRHEGLTLYMQGGLLFGAASEAVADSRGGVTVWLGSGMGLDPGQKSAEFLSHLYGLLDNYYSLVAPRVGS